MILPSGLPIDLPFFPPSRRDEPNPDKPEKPAPKRSQPSPRGQREMLQGEHVRDRAFHHEGHSRNTISQEVAQRWHESHVLRLHTIKIGCEMAGSQSLHHYRGGGVIVDHIGHMYKSIGRQRDTFSIASGRIHPGDSLPGLDAVHSVTDCQYASHPLYAQAPR